MKKTYDENTLTVTIAFDDGLPAVTVDANALPEAVYFHAICHGLSQKLGDAAAIPKSAENNFTVTESMRYEAVRAMADQLMVAWNAPKTTRAPARSPVILALAAKAGVDYDTMAAKLANLDIEALMAA